MTLEKTDLNDKIRKLQAWSPTERHRGDAPRSPSKSKGLEELYKGSGDVRRGFGDFSAVPSREEIVALREWIGAISIENSSLHKAKRDLEASLAKARKELAFAEAKVAESNYAATTAKARVNSLDSDVQKLCDLSKLLTHENATLQTQNKEKDLESKALKAQNDVLQNEVERLSEALNKALEEVGIGRKAREESQAEESRVKEECTKLEMELSKMATRLEQSERHVTEAQRKIEDLSEHIAEVEETLMEYESEVKHMNEEAERISGELEAEKSRVALLEKSLLEKRASPQDHGTADRKGFQEEASGSAPVKMSAASGEESWSSHGKVMSARSIKRDSNFRHGKAVQQTPKRKGDAGVDLHILRRQLSTVIQDHQYHCRNNMTMESDNVVPYEFQKMTAGLSRGLKQVEEELGRWRGKVSNLEEAVKLAKEAASCSEKKAAQLISELHAITGFIVANEPTTNNKSSSSSYYALPAAAAATAVAGGVFAAIKLLKFHHHPHSFA